MPYIVDFENVSTIGLESSPVAEALAGLRANEARYYKNKYDHVFTVSPASEAPEALGWLNRILADERGIVISARPLEVTSFKVDGFRMAYVFYESGLSVNVMQNIGIKEERSAQSGSTSQKAWKFPRNWRHASSSRAKSQSWPAYPRLLLRDQR